MILLLMAAGKGSRYGKLKQFDGLGPKEEFLMEFSMYDAIENGFDHFVVITQKDNVDFLCDYLQPRLPGNLKLDVIPQELTDLPEDISFSGERKKPWGTAHAVWMARHLIDGPFAVINADDYYGKAAYAHAAAFIRDHHNDEQFGLVAYTLNDTLSPHGTVSRGVCKQDGDRLISVEERINLERQDSLVKDLDTGLEFSGSELVSMNFWVCRPSLFPQVEQDLRAFIGKGENVETGEVYLPYVIQGMLQNKKAEVKVIPAESRWFGVTYADDKEKAMAELLEMTESGQYRSPLWPEGHYY